MSGPNFASLIQPIGSLGKIGEAPKEHAAEYRPS